MIDRPILDSGRTEQISYSERAMVPLAIVGVLVLLSSVLVIGYAETRPEPEPDVDTSLALDQTEATMQAVVRDASQRATERAAAEPLTDPADSEWGTVLADSNATLSEDPFENYLRALVYLEVSEDLSLAGEQRGAVTTNVTLPEVTTSEEFGDAIRRVDISESQAELTVTLSNVTLTAAYEGEIIDRRETTVEVTLVSPILQLHEKVSEYQYAIDEAGLGEPGFKQRFNARTYAIGWARGWAQNYHAPVGEVLANRHVEPSANSALYRTQKDVFGAADPNLQNAVRLGWTCMGLKDGEAMFDQYMADRGGIDYDSLQYDEDSREFAYNDSAAIKVPDDVSGGLCSGAHYLFDQVSEKHPEPPEVMDFLGGTNRLEENETLTVGETAYLPLVELVDSDDEYSFENVTRQIFTIEGYVDVETETTDDSLTLDVSCDPGYTAGSISRDAARDVTTSTRIQPEMDEQYYLYHSTVTVTVDAERTCYEIGGNGTDTSEDSDSYTLDVTTTVGEEEDSPFVRIDSVNPASEVSPAHKYTPGPSGWGPTQFDNFDGAQEEVTRSILGDTSVESHEQWLDSSLAGVALEEGPPDVENLETTEVVVLDHDELLGEFKLNARLTDEILEMQEVAANVSVEFERKEMVTNNPTSLLLDELESEIKGAYIDEPTGFQYENVGEKAVYEARYAYYLALVEKLEALESAHDEAIDELDEQISDVDDSLGTVTHSLEHGLREENANPTAFESPSLTENISYDVSGSPTYLLSGQTVETNRVPPVEADGEFAPLRAKNENAIQMPYQEVVNELLAAVLTVVPGASATPDAEITFRMAGDVLTAGERAIAAHEEGVTTDRNDTYLTAAGSFETDVAKFESNVEEALSAFERDVAAGTIARLYPSPEADCLVYKGEIPNDGYPGPFECEAVSDEQDELEGVVNASLSAVESGVDDALDPYGTAETARRIGEGNATDDIVANVTDSLADPQYYEYDEFEQDYDEEQWSALVSSAVRPAVLAASARSVEIGSVDQAEALDESIQEALSNATADAVFDRVEHVSEPIGETVGEGWLGNTDGTTHRAARVPAGFPLLPVPGYWMATVNAWSIDVAGEYARFEASANVATPADGTQMTYVRENHTVSRSIDGTERELGAVEEISFDRQTLLVVITPPGVGVGDRNSDNPECSETYPHVGEVDPDLERNCTEPPDAGEQPIELSP